MASANIYTLKHVDYAERGQQIEIIVNGVPKRQTIIFSGADYFGEKYYFTEQGLRYIQDSRPRRPQQNLVLNYLNKIPIILKSPQVIARNNCLKLFTRAKALRNITGDIMTYRLKAVLDERDFLEIWIPEFNTDPFPELEAGLYKLVSCAKLKGAKRAFDSIMIDGFAKAYPDIVAEVKRKEPPLEQENYDVPELGLYHLQLSRILEEIYCRFVEKKTPSRQKAEVLT